MVGPSPRGSGWSPTLRVPPSSAAPHATALPWALLLLGEVLAQDAPTQGCLLPPAGESQPFALLTSGSIHEVAPSGTKPRRDAPLMG